VVDLGGMKAAFRCSKTIVDLRSSLSREQAGTAKGRPVQRWFGKTAYSAKALLALARLAPQTMATHPHRWQKGMWIKLHTPVSSGKTVGYGGYGRSDSFHGEMVDTMWGLRGSRGCSWDTFGSSDREKHKLENNPL